MINAALQLIPSALGQGRPQIIPAVVAPNTARTPLPTNFNQPLYVTSPTNTDNFWKVADWPADHGGTLPAAGAPVALFYDSSGVLRCAWWDGTYAPPNPPVVTGASWTAPTLLNSWTNQGGSFETVGYLKDPLGFVHVKGVITGGATGSTAFNLPAGYRPGGLTLHPAGNGGATGAVAYAEVGTNGSVSITWATAGNFIGLSGITFLAEN